MKHNVASKNFLKLSLLYVKKVGPTTFTIENLAPVAKSLDTPGLMEVNCYVDIFIVFQGLFFMVAEASYAVTAL